MYHFCSNIYFILAFVQNFNHFDSQPLQTLEWIFVSKDFCTFAGIYVGPCRMSYILLPKISNFRNVGQVKSHIQAARYQTVPSFRRSIYFFLARESTCPPYLLNLCLYHHTCINLFPCLLWLNSEYWITCQLSRFSCKSSTIYILHIFSNVLADWYFSSDRRDF